MSKVFFTIKKKICYCTEHGPRGGDEININDLKDERIKILVGRYHHMVSITPKRKNLELWGGSFYKSHKDYGFDEPLKFFVPSIGISEIKIVPNKFDNTLNDYFIGSMGNNTKEEIYQFITSN